MLVQDALQTTPVSLVLIDPNCLLVETLPKCLREYADVTVVGRSLDVQDGLECLRRQKPDVCLVDADLYAKGFRLFADELAVRLGETRLAIFVDELTDRAAGDRDLESGQRVSVPPGLVAGSRRQSHPAGGR